MNDRSRRAGRRPGAEGLEPRVAPGTVPTAYVAPLVLTTAVTVPDRATGAVKLVTTHDPSRLKVYGSLSNISNVSAVLLRLAPGTTGPGAAATSPPPDPTSTE